MVKNLTHAFSINYDRVKIMKILFNQTLYKNNNINYSYRDNASIVKKQSPSQVLSLSSSNLFVQNSCNVSFGANHDMKFLMNQCNRLRCAYTGKIMLDPSEFRAISQKLLKRPNAQSAINLLQKYEAYMDDIESIIFDIFKESSHKNKRNFQDILKEEAVDAKTRLQEKQINILNKANKIIDTMSESVAEQVRLIRDESLEEVKNDTFGRKAPLEKIKKVVATDDDLKKVIRVYQIWYKSPASAKDLDAFIVKYSKRTHEQIANRLLSGSVASIEHIIPQSRNGSNGLGNFLLVRAQFNNTRNSMPLSEYIALNEEVDIPRHLQNYINDVVRLTNDKRTPFNQRPFYAIKVIETLEKESGNKVKLKQPPIHIPRDILHQGDIFVEKLNKKFNIVNK